MATAHKDVFVSGSGEEKAYLEKLRAMYNRWSKKAAISAKYTNNRYLNTPQKKKDEGAPSTCTHRRERSEEAPGKDRTVC